MPIDAIELLTADHKQIRSTFQAFEDIEDGDNAEKKAELVATMIELLTVHTYIENEIMYPEVRTLVPDLEDDILESYEEHHVADLLVMELYALSADAERFVPKTTVLIENVTHHIEEEEDEWFPKVRKALSTEQLTDLGDRMAEAKKSAPTSPVQPKAMKKTIDAIIK